MHVPQLQGSAPLLLTRCLQTRSSCLKHRAPTVPAPVRGAQCLLETIKNTQKLWLLPKSPLYHPLYDPIACAPAGRLCLTLYLYRRAGVLGSTGGVYRRADLWARTLRSEIEREAIPKQPLEPKQQRVFGNRSKIRSLGPSPNISQQVYLWKIKSVQDVRSSGIFNAVW